MPAQAQQAVSRLTADPCSGAAGRKQQAVGGQYLIGSQRNMSRQGEGRGSKGILQQVVCRR